jgi:flagellar biosynthetic protein FliR
MINFSQLNEIQIILFGLILFRMIAFVVSSAIFSSPAVSVFVKVLFSVVLTLCVYQSVGSNEAIARISEQEDQLILMCMHELFIGLILGFFTRIFFFSLSMGGEIVSISMGLSQGQIFNPMMGSMGNAIEQFYVAIGTLIFLTLNGHHMLIQGIVKSFSVSKIAVLSINVAAFPEIVLKAQEFFTIGIRIAAPVLISMIIVQVGIALLSRAVPQINVMVTSASIATMLGFVLLFVSLPLLVMQMTGLLDLTTVEFFKIIKVI